MKAIIPSILVGALALFVVAQNPAGEQAPPGALEKISAALPEKAYAKPKKARTLLVFSKTNGFRHASIATGKIAFTEMGKKSGAFETVISDDLANFEADALKKFDAVCFLDADNWLAPDHIETMLAEHRASKAPIVGCKRHLMDAEGAPLNVFEKWEEQHRHVDTSC